MPEREGKSGKCHFGKWPRRISKQIFSRLYVVVVFVVVVVVVPVAAVLAIAV